MTTCRSVTLLVNPLQWSCTWLIVPPKRWLNSVKVTQSNVPTLRSLFQLPARARTIFAELLFSTPGERCFDLYPSPFPPPVACLNHSFLSPLLMCTSNHLPIYLIMILRYATLFPGESNGAAPLLHMAHVQNVRYIGSLVGARTEEVGKREDWLSLAAQSQNTPGTAWLTYARSRHKASFEFVGATRFAHTYDKKKKEMRRQRREKKSRPEWK